MRRGLGVLLLPLWVLAAQAQVPTTADYAGRWSADFNGQKVELELKPDPQQPAMLAGSISVGAGVSQLLCTVDKQTGELSGAVLLQKAADGQAKEFRDYLQLQAELHDGSLMLNIAFQEGARQFELHRDGAAPGIAHAPKLSPEGLFGSWHFENQGQTVDLTLQPGEGGRWSGTLLLGGTTLPLAAQLDEAKGQVQGVVQLEKASPGAQPKEFQHFVYFTVAPQPDGALLTIKLQNGDREYPLKRPAGSTSAPQPVAPAGFAGDYTFENLGQTVTLKLEPAADGGWRGTLGLGGGLLPLTGKLDAAKNALQGVIQMAPTPAGATPKEFEQFVYFVAELTPEGVTLQVRLQAGDRTFPMRRQGTSVPAGPWAGDYAYTQPEGGVATLELKADARQPGNFVGTVTLGQQALPLVAKPGEHGLLIGVIQARKTPAGEQPKEFTDVFYFTAEPTAVGLKLTVRFQNGEQSFPFQRQPKAAPRNPLGL